jgi:hypothetical protein
MSVNVERFHLRDFYPCKRNGFSEIPTKIAINSSQPVADDFFDFLRLQRLVSEQAIGQRRYG